MSRGRCGSMQLASSVHSPEHSCPVPGRLSVGSRRSWICHSRIARRVSHNPHGRSSINLKEECKVGFRLLDIDYQEITCCPLCGQAGAERSVLRRPSYYFARFEIPLPRTGVALLECRHCSLLFKSATPTAESCDAVMLNGATDVWRPKTGEHPALPMMRPYMEGAESFLDIGASNGDLLAQIGARRLSAMDIVQYAPCKAVIDGRGEYIIGQLEKGVTWSNQPYDVVTAFDVFEHFLEADSAVSNVLAFVKSGGYLVIETGDWRTVPDPGSWYYTNLFEHQIFWTRRTFEYLQERFPLAITQYSLVNHKGRR